MILTTSEFVVAMQNEVRILLHLAGKINRAELDYRPTPLQSSTLELLQYLSMMGPELVRSTLAGAFDADAWTAAEHAAASHEFDDAVATIALQSDVYGTLLANVTNEELRTEMELFGDAASRGSFLVNLVLGSCIAYRMQLFLYLKSCGRAELGSSNLWYGVDAPAIA